jgi:transposase
MDVLYPRCAGLDVHKDTVVACARVASDGAAKSEVRSFDTTTAGLLALSAWLAASGCTHVAMEATGVYWKPVWHILSDGEVTLILANAAHVKNVPGRKTDVADAVWLADLLAHGLIRASFVPEALQGRVTERHRFLLRLHLRHIDALDTAIAEIDAEVNRDVDPFQQAVRQLQTIPGVSDLCPRNDESAGKRRSTRLRKGAPWLKTTVVQCAWAASRKKASYLQAQSQRLRSRRGPKKAICAVAASILTDPYHMLRDGTFYHDLGADHFHRYAPEVQANRLARQIAKLGFKCTRTPARTVSV